MREVAARVAPRMRLAVMPPYYDHPDYVGALVAAALCAAGAGRQALEISTLEAAMGPMITSALIAEEHGLDVVTAADHVGSPSLPPRPRGSSTALRGLTRS